ncbi:MAG: GGDEF domain-containing protein [Planctomycetota bacterium]|nr:GGDEF domain-containing protein [Planctomycetota bacterium]
MWDRAIKDEKTGLYNANHYQDQMKRQVAIAQRTGAPLSLIMMDIDKFKHINDTYGHLAGDTVLAEVSAILKREARESDTPYRYGGEELCIVCCGTSEEDAAKAAERMRHKIACTEFHDDRGRLLPISASFGVAEFDPAHMHSEKDLKEACDRALYVAKENGRNLVVVHAGSEQFHKLERSGDANKEVKRRLGLAGDNSPLDGDRDPAPIADEKQASARALLGESIDKLATGLAEVVGSDSDRARVVDTVVREAAEFLTRNLSARLGEEPGLKRAAPEPEPADKPKRKRARRKTPPMEQPAQAEGAPAAAPKPKRRRKSKKEQQAEEAAAALKKLQAEEDAQLSADSDRLDYLTDDEGEQLARGEAPSKRLRKAARKSA